MQYWNAIGILRELMARGVREENEVIDDLGFLDDDKAGELDGKNEDAP